MQTGVLRPAEEGLLKVADGAHSPKLSLRLKAGWLGLALAAAAHAATASAGSFEDAQALLKKYCQPCHMGKASAGGFNLSQVNTTASFAQHAGRWTRVAFRVRNGEMPPRGVPAPPLAERDSFAALVNDRVKAAVCANGPVPGPSPVRRLNRSEYSATIHDLFSMPVDVGASLPADGAGGEGFDNAAETLFLSPIHAEKYLDAARLALDFAGKYPAARERVFIAAPGHGVTPEQAAHTILANFLPRAFRRPVREKELAPYLDLFRLSQKRGETFEGSIRVALEGVLISPQFLFRIEPPNPGPAARQVDDYTLASRLSYFLWGSTPDGLLLDLAAAGRLNDPEILKGQVERMLRNAKSLELMRRFVEQWLGTRELGKDINPDAGLFPIYAKDEELRADIGYQPILFFQELVSKNLSLLNLIDSNFTMATAKLEKLYGLKLVFARGGNKEQPQRVDLPEGSHRGGLLGMAAVLIATSYPNRTSPVLRGKWVLDAMLGTPPPPPPPNVPKLDEGQAATAKTVRERLEQHRADPVCASCHSRIDPLGFALENYDPLGRWRAEDAGKPLDVTGELPDGTKFQGPEEMKAVLLARKDLFLRNLTNKMLGYALGRGLTVQDSCTVDGIVANLEKNEYGARTLIEQIVFSMPFRYQAGAPAQTPASESAKIAQKE